MAYLGASPFTITTTGLYFIPIGVTSLTVECWGSGGNGSAALDSHWYGAGGGGGAYAKVTTVVTPGEQYGFYVSTSPAQPAYFNKIGGSTYAYAGGGANGILYGPGGVAGVATIGDVLYNGGTGGQSNTASGKPGSGGGEGAGTTANGHNGGDGYYSRQGGTGSGGGHGGDGGQYPGNANLNSNIGFPGGGGGGGAEGAAWPGGWPGGTGSGGKIVVTYTVGPYTSPITIPETTTLTIPAGVNSLMVECYSGGGSGGAGNQATGGGGGGAGGYAKRNSMRVIPLKTYTFTVANSVIGQTGSVGYKYGLNGLFTYFTGEDTVICQARSGTGGTSTAYGNPTGTAYGDVAYDGGHGGQYSTGGGAGGGGEGASNVLVGNNGVDGNAGGAGGAGGTGGAGGDGGKGGDVGLNAVAGTAPGGAGGGGGAYNGSTYGNSGGGAKGQMIITYLVNLTTRAFNGGVACDQSMSF